MNKSPQKCHNHLAALAAALLCLPLAATADEPQDAKPGEAKRIDVVVTAVEQTPEVNVETVTLSLDPDEVKPGKYWIGVVCAPLEDELLKAHLDLQHGLVVTEVVPDSPARQAGLQPRDIMVRVAEKPLKDLKVLVSSIEEAQDEEVTLTIIRKGEKQEVKITPAERPAKSSQTWAQPDAETAKEWKMLQEALRQQGAVPRKDDEGVEKRDLSLMLVMPGVILPDQAQNLPKNLEVTITKKGEDEAKITVKRDDESWEVDAGALDKLPDDVRPHIEKMLGKGRQMQFHFDAKGLNWMESLPQGLKAPRILNRSLKIVPDKVYELQRLEQGLNKELREKIQQRLQQANKTLEEAKSQIPAEALERVENELKVLREQIEQLRKEREQKEKEKENENADENRS